MKTIRLCLSLLMLLQAGPLIAATWTVTSNATMTAANNGAVPGDVILMSDGTYTVDIDPARSGTANQRITYIGNLTNRQNVTVPFINLGGKAGGCSNSDAGLSYITVKGVRSLGGANNCGYSLFATGDSILTCDLEAGIAWDGKVVGLVVKGNVIGDSTANASVTSSNLDRGTAYNPASVIVEDNTINIADEAGMKLSNNDSLTWRRNRTHALLAVGNPGDILIWWVNLRWSTISDSYFRVKNTLYDEGRFWIMRDDCYGNLFLRDSLYEDTTSTKVSVVQFNNSGGEVPPSPVYNNRYQSCVFRMNQGRVTDYNDGLQSTVLDSCRIFSKGYPALDLGSEFQDGSAITHSVVESQSGPAMRLRWVAGNPGLPNLIESNTFRGVPTTGSPGVVELLMGGGNAGLEAPLVVRNNVLNSRTATGGTLTGMLVRFPDSSATYLDRLTENHNLYANLFGGGTANQAIAWGYGASGLIRYSRPGTTGIWYTKTGEGGNSVATGNGAAQAWLKGPMNFTDSTNFGLSLARVNASPLTFSAARGNGSAGKDIGAVQGSTADNVRPAPILDLTVTGSNASGTTLQWTSVGDDSLTGTVHHYEVRGMASTEASEIDDLFIDPDDESGWTTLNRIMAPLPGDPLAVKPGAVGFSFASSRADIPAAPEPEAVGAVQSLTFNQWVTTDGVVQPLSAINAGSYIGVWVAAVDEAGNRSAVSNRGVIWRLGALYDVVVP